MNVMKDGQNPPERIKEIRSLCAQRGARRTALREQVLVVLLNAQRPLGAYEIIDSLRDQLTRSIAPPTVYRALAFLIEQGFASKIESQNAYIVCADPERTRRGLYFICDECGSSVEMEDPRIEALLAQDAAGLDFSVTRRVMEIQGTCKTCTEHAPSPN